MSGPNPSDGVYLNAGLLGVAAQIGNYGTLTPPVSGNTGIVDAAKIVRSLDITNTNASTVYVQIYDSAASPTTGNPKLAFGVTATSARRIDGVDYAAVNGVWIVASTAANGSITAPGTGVAVAAAFDALPSGAATGLPTAYVLTGTPPGQQI